MDFFCQHDTVPGAHRFSPDSMTFLELLQPLSRNVSRLVVYFLIYTSLFFVGMQTIPTPEETTIFYTVKIPGSTEGTDHYSLDAVESAGKIAEAVAGWAKNPAFRQKILDRAGVEVSSFRKKISARRQSRLNIFWTLSLPPSDAVHSNALTQALISVLQEDFQTFTNRSVPAYELTPAQTFRELRTIPVSWIALGAIFSGLLLAFVTVYIREALGGKILFVSQLRERFPRSLMLRVDARVGKHESKIVEQFILTFESPRLVGAFASAKHHFSLAPMDAIDENLDTAVILVRLGDTTLRELENLQAIFGDEVGFIIFER